MPTFAGKWKKQKPDTVLPQRSGTTAWQLIQAAHGTTTQGMRYYRSGTDVKNYIRSYYRKGAALAWWAAVVRLQGSGTTVGTSGTTAPPRGTTVDAYGTTVDPGAVLPQPTTAARQGRQENGGSSKEEGGDKKETCM